jgi:hypothetical protein
MEEKMRPRNVVFVIFMMSSGCAAQKESDNAAPDEMLPNQAVMATAVEPIGEATDPLTYKQCYTVIFAVTKTACLRTHTPLLDCLVIADGAARTACKNLQGSGQ